MEDKARALGVDGPGVWRIELNGRVWIFLPLTYGDIAEFEAWIKQTVYAGLADAQQHLDARTYRNLVTDTASQFSAGHYRTGMPGWVQFVDNNLDGLYKLAALSLKHKHPDVMADDVAQIVTEKPEEFRNALVEILSDPRVRGQAVKPAANL